MLSKRGFNLTEILLAISLISLIILVVTSLDITSRRFFGNIGKQTQVQDEAKIAMEHIIKNVQLGVGNMTNAGTIGSPPGANNSRGFYILDSGGNLADNGSRIQIKQAGKTVEYRYDSANRRIEYDPDISVGGDTEFLADKIITNTIFNIGSAPNEIDVAITTRQDPTQAESLNNPETTLTSTVILRAMSCN